MSESKNWRELVAERRTKPRQNLDDMASYLKEKFEECRAADDLDGAAKAATSYAAVEATRQGLILGR